MKNRFNPEELRKFNNEDRMWFVEYWANYVKTHADKEWSRQQNVLINSMMKNALSMTAMPIENGKEL